MGKLDGQNILVTGAARRIGRAIALRLASEGAQLAIHYGGSQAEAEEVARQTGGRAFHADLSQVAEIRRLYSEIETAMGKLDAVVNNAARFKAMAPLTLTEADWDAIHSVNVKAVFFSCQCAARMMLPRGGRIVNLSSLGGIRPWKQFVPYGAAKAGVIMLTRSLAKAWAPKITVNSVAPGVIEFGDTVPGPIQHLVDATPAQKHGSGDDIADAVMYFLTASNYVTGQVLAVDGGLQHAAPEDALASRGSGGLGG